MDKKKLFVIPIILIAFLGSYAVFWFVGNHIEAPYNESAKLFKKQILTDSINQSPSATSYGSVKDDTGTPLFFYAQSIDAAKHMVERRGASTKLTNTKGETVLHYTINSIVGYNTGEKIPLLKYFLRKGLNPYQPDEATGSTPKDLMKNKTCKGKKVFWDNEVLLLVNDPDNELLAPNKYRYDHTFTNPRMGIKSTSNNQHKFTQNGYEFFAESKSNHSQKLILSYRGSILNRSLSKTIHNDNYDFETCVVKGKNWVCKNRTTGTDTIFESPQAIIISNMENILWDSDRTYSTFANSKNLQPNGKIYLSYTADIPDNFVVSVEYPKIYDFDSIKLYYGSWVGNEK